MVLWGLIGGCGGAQLRAEVDALKAEKEELLERLAVAGVDQGSVYGRLSDWELSMWAGQGIERYEREQVDSGLVFTMPEGCESSELVSELAAAKMFWVRLGPGRLLAQPLVMSKIDVPWDALQTGAPKAVVAALLDYHDKVVGTPDWEAALTKIAEAPVDYESDAQRFWEAGFPKSEDPCLTTGGVSYDAEAEEGGEGGGDTGTGEEDPYQSGYADGYDAGFAEGVASTHTEEINVYWYDGTTAEYWLYSFWLRRHREGTMEAVADALHRISAVE
jgi:hypothetical protein